MRSCFSGLEQRRTAANLAEIINDTQEKAGLSDRVDCRSHQARGLSEQLAVHEGYHARQMENEDFETFKTYENRRTQKLKE